MTEVLFVKPGAITAGDRGRLRKAGVVVVETERPEDARFVTPAMTGGNLPSGDLLAAMARAVIRLPHVNQDLFAQEIAKAIVAAHDALAHPKERDHD